MVAKMILPRFGGSPAVWTASMLFFQALLLLGYAYAHWSTKWLGARRQSLVHIVVLVLAALTLPIVVPQASIWTPGRGGQFEVLLVLGIMVGAAFFAVSAGAPLIQRWFANTSDPAARDPYFLYSASNLGSMAALLAYPFLMEPQLKLGEQSKTWTYAFYGLAALMALCAILLQRQPLPAEEHQAEDRDVAPISRQQKLRWLLLSAIPSSLLLGVTNYLTTNIAPIPLLWVVPLALYLLTFIVAFARKQYVKASTWARVLPIILTPLALIMILEATEPLWVLAMMHLAAFTVAALMCHTMLAESRPPAARLTEFYLWLSLGGVLGGFFNAIVAPVVFKTLAEYPIAIVLAALVRPPKEGVRNDLKRDALFFGIGMLLLTMSITYIAMKAGMPANRARTALVIGLPAIICFLMVDRPYRYAFMLGAVFLGANLMGTNAGGRILETDRSFFGVHRVLAIARGESYHELVHGTTIHGMQDTLNPGEPKTYYTRTSPIGEVFKAFSGTKKKRHVGLVGLGVGSCAAYGEPGQQMTYFEIDPVVERIAKDPKYFTFLRDTKASLNVVLGDARLTLGREKDNEFGLLVLDAFSSDAIPIHLLTREAVEMYQRKLEPGGIMAFHISNRYLDLEPILARIASDLGMQAYVEGDEPSTDEWDVGKRPSRWVVLCNSPHDVKDLLANRAWSPARVEPSTPLWTDDYSNILSAFKHESD